MPATVRRIPAFILLGLYACNAMALCPDGRPEPCIRLTPLPLTPSINIEKWALPPQIKSFQLASPPPAAAPVQLAIAAAPSPTQEVKILTQRAAQILSDIQFRGYEILFQGLTTILSPRSPSSPTAEVKMREAQQLMREYLAVLREIERITLGIRIGGENYDRRVAQLQIVQGRINEINVDLNPLYSVHRGNATIHIEDPNPPRTPNCRTKTVYETKIINIIVSAGFDERGNPVKRQGRDIVQQPKDIVVCD